jgi:flagellar assembly factor FliW
VTHSQDTLSFATTRFGRITVPADKTVEIQGGILGFPGSTRYVILDHEENSPFRWLQSLDQSELAFVIADPMIFFPDYKVHFRKEEYASLGIEDEGDAVIFVILSLNSQIHEMTANLQGPIIVSAKNRAGRQIVLKDSTWRTRHPLFPASA